VLETNSQEICGPYNAREKIKERGKEERSLYSVNEEECPPRIPPFSSYQQINITTRVK
jgi:hypothetical protein